MNWYPFAVNILVSSVELCVGLLLTFSIFRIPLRYNIVRAVIIGILMSSLSYYLRDIAKLADYAIITVLLLEIIMILLFFELPFFYSFIIAIIGFFLGALVEYLLILVGTSTGITTVELLTTNYIHLSIHHLAATLILLLFIYLLQRRKYGFMFIKNKMATKNALKGYNFILSAIFLTGIVIMQIALANYNNNLSIHLYFLVILLVIFLIGIIIAYKHNRKMLNEKYERLKNR